MIDINELRPAVEAAGLNAISMQEVLELLDRLEAAESECLEQARLNGMGGEREAALLAKLEAAEKTKSDWLRANAPGGWVDDLRAERDAMRARIEEMEKDIALKERIIDSLGSTLNAVANGRDELRAELDALKAWKEEVEKQEPKAWMLECQTLGGDTGWILSWTQSGAGLCDRLKGEEHEKPLYARPVPASVPTEAVGYLDLGVGGYIDIGSDLSDEELSKLPKGLHALAIVGTWGVDGYVPAPAQSVPEGWKLVPIEPTEEMINEGACASTLPGPRYIDSACAKQCWATMLAATPEAKP